MEKPRGDDVLREMQRNVDCVFFLPPDKSTYPAHCQMMKGI
jgi:hypothetical protein